MYNFHCCGNHYSESEVWPWLLFSLILNSFSKPAGSSPVMAWSSIPSQFNLLETFLPLDCICLIYPLPQTYCFAYDSLNCFCCFFFCSIVCLCTWGFSFLDCYCSTLLPKSGPFFRTHLRAHSCWEHFPDTPVYVKDSIPDDLSYCLLILSLFVWTGASNIQDHKLGEGVGERGLFIGHSAACLLPFSCLLDGSSFFSFSLWGLPILTSYSVHFAPCSPKTSLSWLKTKLLFKLESQYVQLKPRSLLHWHCISAFGTGSRRQNLLWGCQCQPGSGRECSREYKYTKTHKLTFCVWNTATHPILVLEIKMFNLVITLKEKKCPLKN